MGLTLFQDYGTYEEENLGSDLNVTASLGSPPVLSKKWTVVTSVPSNNSAVRLPQAKLGMMFSIKHLDSGHPTNVLLVLPAAGESINNNINTAVSISILGVTGIFICGDGGDWKAII